MEINKKIITKNPNYQFDKIIANNPSINQNLAQEYSKIYTNVNKIETRFPNKIETRFPNNIETRFPNNKDLHPNQKNPEQIIHSSKSFYGNSFLSSDSEQYLDYSVAPPIMNPKKDAVVNGNSEKKYPIYPFYQEQYTENYEQYNISKIITKKGNEEHKKDNIHSYDEKNKKIYTFNKDFIFEDQKKLRYSLYGDPMNEVTLEYNSKYN